MIGVQLSPNVLPLCLQDLRPLSITERPIVIEQIRLIGRRSNTRRLPLLSTVDSLIVIVKGLSSGSGSIVTSDDRRLIPHGKLVRRVLPSPLGIIAPGPQSAWWG